MRTLSGSVFPPGHRFYTDQTRCHMDIIFIDDLRLSTLIGIYPREKAAPQMLEISLQIGTSTTGAGASDDIGDTIDYAVVVDRLRHELSARHFNLLEKLAEYVAGLLLDDFSATWVRVSIAKLGVISGVRRVGVVIERRATAS
jgi:dihydroneopterin aldolase